MAGITLDMIKRAYQVAKQVYKKEIGRSEGIQILVDECDMASAGDYIQAYKEIKNGSRYTRTINAMAIEYYLTHIFIDAGIEALKKAVNAVSEHTDYYEEIKDTNMNKNWAIIGKFNKMIENNFHEVEELVSGVSC